MMTSAPGAVKTAYAGDQEDYENDPDIDKKVVWHPAWPRVRWWEVLNIVALTIGSAYINAAPYHKTANWKGPILFDKPVRKLMRLNSAEGQERIATISDYLYRGMVLTPYIIDNFIAALSVHQNPDVALQMTLINMQSLGLSGVVSLGAQHAIGRARPYTDDCPPGGVGLTKVGFSTCGGPADNQSFYSGHAAAAFTMAGLTCVHHQHLPLYGGGWADAVPCIVMMASASVTSLARLWSDRHWASDVILGTAVGLFNGYLIPSWLHYGFGKYKPIAAKTAIKTEIGTIAPIPQIYEGGAGFGFAVF